MGCAVERRMAHGRASVRHREIQDKSNNAQPQGTCTHDMQAGAVGRCCWHCRRCRRSCCRCCCCCCAPCDQEAVAACAACQGRRLGEAVEQDGLRLGNPERLRGREEGRRRRAGGRLERGQRRQQTAWPTLHMQRTEPPQLQPACPQVPVCMHSARETCMQAKHSTAPP